MAEIVQFQNNPNSLPQLPRSLAVFIDDGGKSPVEWEGDWYQDKDMRWRFQPRLQVAGYKFDPESVPEPIQQDARRTLDRLDASMEPATESEIAHALGEISIVCGSKQSDGAEVWRARYAIYVRHLDDIPRDLLRKAMDDHIESSVFFPKVAELRALAGSGLAERKRQIRELRRLLGMSAHEPSTMELIRERAGRRP